MSNPLLCDNSLTTTTTTTENLLPNTQGEEEEFNNTPMSPVILTKSLRIKRWIYWRCYGHREFNSLEGFQKAWNPRFSVRKAVRAELKAFAKDPINFIKQEIKRERAYARWLDEKKLRELDEAYWGRRPWLKK